MISKFELEEELTIQYTTYFRQFGKLFWLESQNTQSKTLHFTILVSNLVVIVYPEVVAEQRIGLCVASLCLSHYGCRSQSKALSGFQFDLNFNEVNTVDTQSNKTVLLLQMIYTASSVYDDGIYTRATVTGDYSFFTQFPLFNIFKTIHRIQSRKCQNYTSWSCKNLDYIFQTEKL